MDEKKAVEFKIEDGKFHLIVDPNKDGEPLLELTMPLSELADEIIDALGGGNDEPEST